MSFLKDKAALLIGFSFLLSLGAAFFPNAYLSSLILLSLAASALFALKSFSEVSLIKKEFEVKTRGFNFLAESLDDGVIIYDPDFTVLAMNGAAERIFGIRGADFVGKRLQPKTGFAGGEALLVECVFPSLAPSSSQISEPNVWPQVVEISAENPPRKLRTALSRVPGPGGEASYFIKTVRDETHEQGVLASKDEFISVAAHQLRTPLTSINWALESIAKTAVEDPRGTQETAAQALGTSERVLKIVNDLLEVAKMDEGKTALSAEKTPLAAFLREVVALAEPFAKERSVTLFFMPIPPEWEGASASIDKGQLGAACANLIENAVKYNTKQGEVSVTLEVFPERNTARVSVKDTGLGIPEKDKESIFGKFFRGGNVASAETDGSGLGLYIVKSIVERHGGRVGFESRENRGSTFWFTLPLSKEDGQ